MEAVLEGSASGGIRSGVPANEWSPRIRVVRFLCLCGMANQGFDMTVGGVLAVLESCVVCWSTLVESFVSGCFRLASGQWGSAPGASREVNPGLLRFCCDVMGQLQSGAGRAEVDEVTRLAVAPRG